MENVPVRLSPAQIRKLKVGGAIGLKPANFMMGEGHTPMHSLALLPANLRKIATANRRGKGMRLMLNPNEDVMDITTGGSILGKIKSAFKSVGKTVKKVASKGADAVVKVAKSRQVKKIGRQVASQLIRKGIPVASQALGSALGTSLATVSGNPELAPMAGKLGAKLGQRGGQELSKYVSRKTGYGMRLPSGVIVPMKGMPNRGGIRKMGDGFKPAGGDKSGSGMMVSAPEPPSDVIQLGSPYAKIHSASMNPFIAPSIQLAGKKHGAGFNPSG